MKLNILTLGDSIAAGVIAGGEYNSYEGASENLAKLLSAKNEIGFYQNWALSGETTDEFFDLVSMDYSSKEFLRRLENNWK